MGHQHKTTNNNHGGDSPIKGFYLSPFTRTISIGIIIFSVAFLVSCLTASIVTPVQNSDATTAIDLNDNSVAYFVNIASATNGTAGVISKEVNATAAGTLGIIEDRLSITSNTPNGYKVYVSMANNTNQQKLVNIDDSSYFFNPISGSGISLSNPGNLSQANTWGVAVASTWNSHFDNVSAYTANPIAQTTKFAPVPAYGEEELLITQDDTTTASTQTDNISVYYGYHATSALPSGTYRNTVLYTAYSEATDHAGGIATYTGSGLDYKTGGTLTITTSLYTDRTIKANEVSVSVVDGAENKPCTIANDAAITKVDAGSNDSVRIVCSAPSVTKPGYYTLKVDIDGYAHHSTNTVFYDTPGLTATVAGNPVTITEMQDMTGDVCLAWNDSKSASVYNYTKNKPYAYTNGDTTPTYRYGSDLSTLESTVVADAEANSDTISTATWNIVVDTTKATSGSAISNINADVPETYLKDSRDGNYYRIRKFADGNCWMTENLRIVFNEDDVNSVGIIDGSGNIVAQTPTVTINENNTNVGSSAIGGLTMSNWDETIFTDSLAYTETAQNKTNWNAEKNKHSALSTADSEDTTTENSVEYSRSYYEQGELNGLDSKFLRDSDTQAIGTYYNWKTTTAGTGNASASNSIKKYGDSICPKGWRLPENSYTNKSFYNLIINSYAGGSYSKAGNPSGTSQGIATSAYAQKVNGAHIFAAAQTIRRAPLSIPLSGFYVGTTATSYHIALRGMYWSNLSTTANQAGILDIYDSRVVPVSTIYKGRGYSIRCLAPSTYDMQDVANWEDSVGIGDVVTAVDTRDGNEYTVSRLPDGNLWMTENLRLTFSNGYALHTDGTTLTALDNTNTDLQTQSTWSGAGTTENSTNNTVWYSDSANLDNLAKSYTFGPESSTNDDATQYKGTFYNWLTATAGKGLYSTVNTTVEDSICPKGWRLPINGDATVDKSWAKLLSYAGSSDNSSAWSTAARSYPYSLVRVGFYNSTNGALDQANLGGWWSATARSNGRDTYSLALRTSGVVSQSTGTKGDGGSVRCVQRD